MAQVEVQLRDGELEGELKKLNRLLKIVRSCKNALLHANDERYLLTEVCRVLAAYGGYRFCWVGQAQDNPEREVRPIAFWGEDHSYLETLAISWADVGPGTGTPSGTAIRTGKPVRMRLKDAAEEAEDWAALAVERGFLSVLSFPLSLAQETRPMGAFTVYSGNAESFAPEEELMLSELAGDIAHGIENVRRNRERRKAVAELKMAEARYSGVLENTGTGTIVIENDELIRFCNATFEKMTGFDREEIVGKRKWSDFVVPEDAQRMENYHVWRRTEPGRAPSVYECQMNTRAGEVKDILMKVGMVEGTRVSVASFMDISEAKRTRDLLEEKEAQLAGIVENFGGPIFIRDMKGRLAFANKALRDRAGYNPSGEYCHKVLFGRKTPCEECPAERVLAGETVRKEVFIEGCGIWYEAVYSPIIQADGTIIRVQAVFSDITDRKASETALMAREETLLAENRRLKAEVQDRWRFGGLVGKSLPMQEVYERVLKAAASPANVILYGESGTGKELTARAIHDQSERKDGPFIPVNCGAIGESLVESAFFGHRKGAFTGADRDREGVLAAASGGTLFLDEIGEISVGMQVKLLRALDDAGFTPVGGTDVIRSDFRIVAATNRNLYELLKNNQMREDFFYRIHVIPIRLPALRDRKEDLPLLVDHFFKKYDLRGGKGEARYPITGKLIEAFTHHEWPGNVRELQNAVQRYLSLGSLDFLEERHGREEDRSPEDLLLKDRVEQFERKLILESLNRNQWHREVVATELDIHRKTLFTKMKKYGLM